MRKGLFRESSFQVSPVFQLSVVLISLSVHRALPALARDLRSVALSLKMYEQLKVAKKVGRWNFENEFPWIESVLKIADPSDPLGVAVGADSILDQVKF